MTQTEYEQKRFNEWLRYKHDNFGAYSPDAKIVFYYAFDRAYAIGMQDGSTQSTESKSMQLSDVKAKIDKWMNSHTEEEVYELLKRHGVIEGAEETVISGWVARDKDGERYLYENKPERGFDEWLGRLSSKFDFQQLKWESDPIEVELIIKRKKNG